MDDAGVGRISGEYIGGLSFDGEMARVVVEGDIRGVAVAARFDAAAHAGRGALLGCDPGDLSLISDSIGSVAIDDFFENGVTLADGGIEVLAVFKFDGLPGGGGNR